MFCQGINRFCKVREKREGMKGGGMREGKWETERKQERKCEFAFRILTPYDQNESQSLSENHTNIWTMVA